MHNCTLHELFIGDLFIILFNKRRGDGKLAFYPSICVNNHSSVLADVQGS